MTVTEQEPESPASDPAEALAAAEAADEQPASTELAVPAPAGWAAKANPVTGLSIVPAQDEIRMLASLANTLCSSALVPVALRDKPADVFLVLLTARDNGVAITTALREFHPIDGKVSMSPKVRHAMANQRAVEMGWRIYPEADNDAWQATWVGIKDGATYSVTFTWQNGQQAKLVGRECEPGNHTDTCHKGQPGKGNSTTVCKSNWYQWEGRMLSARARGYLLDDAFPEVATGLYSPDELGAITDDEGNPVDLDSVEVPTGMPQSRRQRQRAQRGTEQEDKPLTDDERAGFQARIDHLPAEARDELVKVWTKPKHDENNNVVGHYLPPLGRCHQSHLRKMEAVLASVEQRAKRGTWGDWQPLAPTTEGASQPAAEPETPTPSPATDATPAEPDTPPTADSDDAGDNAAREELEQRLAGPTPELEAELEAIATAYEALTPHQVEWLTAAVAKEGLRHDQLEQPANTAGRELFRQLLAGAGAQPAEPPSLVDRVAEIAAKAGAEVQGDTLL
jgi:hypothetical protein